VPIPQRQYNKGTTLQSNNLYKIGILAWQRAIFKL
jgi:hypothetical protein